VQHESLCRKARRERAASSETWGHAESIRVAHERKQGWEPTAATTPASRDEAFLRGGVALTPRSRSSPRKSRCALAAHATRHPGERSTGCVPPSLGGQQPHRRSLHHEVHAGVQMSTMRSHVCCASAGMRPPQQLSIELTKPPMKDAQATEATGPQHVHPAGRVALLHSFHGCAQLERSRCVIRTRVRRARFSS